MIEEAFLAGTTTHPLVCVASAPEMLTVTSNKKPAIILLNAGIVHHIGPGRWSVRLARRLADQGHVAVRFDHGGIGDSDARRDSIPFNQSSVMEVGDVMSKLTRRFGVTSFVLIGLCSGSSTAILTAQADSRISAVIAINPPGGADADAQVDQHLLNEGWAKRYLSVAILDPRSWWRAVTGRIEYRRLLRVLSSHLMNRLRPAPQLTGQLDTIAALLCELADRGTRIFFVFSANDEGSGFAMQLMKNEQLQRRVAIAHRTIVGSDHTFALHCNQEDLFAVIDQFLSNPAPPTTHTSTQSV